MWYLNNIYIWDMVNISWENCKYYIQQLNCHILLMLPVCLLLTFIFVLSLVVELLAWAITGSLLMKHNPYLFTSLYACFYFTALLIGVPCWASAFGAFSKLPYSFLLLVLTVYLCFLSPEWVCTWLGFSFFYDTDLYWCLEIASNLAVEYSDNIY